MQEIQASRILITATQYTAENASKLIAYGKKLLTVYRRVWFPPPQNTFIIEPSIWEEELMLVCLRIGEIFLSNPKNFVNEGLNNPYISLITYAAINLDQTDIILDQVSKVVQYLDNPDVLIPLYILNNKPKVVALLQHSASNNISKAIAVAAHIFIHNSTNSQYLPLLEEYPGQLISLEADRILRYTGDVQRSYDYLIEKLVSYSDNSQILYNAAYLSCKLLMKEKAFEYARKALSLNHSDSRILLLVLRILHSNSQFRQALSLLNTSLPYLDHVDHSILAEGMFLSAENNDVSGIDFFYHKAARRWGNDENILHAAIRANLMVSRASVASALLHNWSETNQQTAEFFYLFSNISMLLNNTNDALMYARKALELNPVSAEMNAGFAIILFKTGKKDKALYFARTAVEIDPQSLDGWAALTQIADGDEEKEALKKAIAVRKNFVNLDNLEIMLFPYELRHLS